MISLSESVEVQAREVLNIAQPVLARMLAALTLFSSSGQSPIFYHRARLKSLSSIKEKIVARRRTEPAFGLADISDVVGFRLVALYDEQLPSVFQIARRIMETSLSKKAVTPHDRILHTTVQSFMDEYKHRKKEATLAPLHQCNLWELIPQAERRMDGAESLVSVDWWEAVTDVCFYCRSEGDTYHEGYKVLIESAPAQYKHKITHVIPPNKIDLTKDRPYSSLHIHYRVAAPQGHRPSTRSVAVEVQIRTAIEDVWAEIDHINDYKIRNSDVWNEDLEDKYASLDQNSLDLKRIMNDLQDKVTSIRNTYYQAQDLFRRFKIPQTETYQSLIMLLAESLVSRYTQRDAMALFLKYEECLKSLDPTASKSDQERVLQECLKVLGQISELFGSGVGVVRKDTKELFERLMEFEIIRLEAVLHCLPLPLYHTREGDISRPVLDATHAHPLQLLQFRLNELEAKHWRTRPTVLFNFWNYYIAIHLRGGQNADARFYLFAAYDALRIDQSLPVHSVYKVVVPRAVAQIYFSEALMVEATSRASELTKGMFKENLQFLFAMALRFGAEARREHSVEHARRGDFIFGRRPIEKIFDEAYFVQYSMKCVEYGLRTALEEVYHVTVPEIINVLRELEKFQFGDPTNDPKEDDAIAGIVVSGYKYFGCIDESNAYGARWEEHCRSRGSRQGEHNERG